MIRVAFVLLAICLARTASADTVVFRAAELNLPDEGWTVQTTDSYMTLALEAGGAIIELYDFSKAPAPDAVAIAKLVGGRQETTAVNVGGVKPHKQHGLTGIAFHGTAQVRSSPVRFNAVALDGFRGRAVVAIAIMRANLDAAQQRAIGSILGTLRGAQTR